MPCCARSFKEYHERNQITGDASLAMGSPFRGTPSAATQEFDVRVSLLQAETQRKERLTNRY